MTTPKTKVAGKKETTLAKPEPQTTEVANVAVDQLISKAIDKGLPVETMEKLLAMFERVNAIRAKAQFTQAMADFQHDCPIIEKRKVVKDNKGNVRYKYATLDSIVDQTREIIGKHGLSYTIKTTNDGSNLTATCKVTHIGGHSEESSFSVPIGNEQYMTDVQKFGARATFAKRYAFCDTFGIMTGDADTDATQESIGEPQAPKSAPARPVYQQKAQPAQIVEQKATDAQISEIIGILESKGKDIYWLERAINRKLSELTEAEADKVLSDIRPKPAQSGIQDAQIE